MQTIRLQPAGGLNRALISLYTWANQRAPPAAPISTLITSECCFLHKKKYLYMQHCDTLNLHITSCFHIFSVRGKKKKKVCAGAPPLSSWLNDQGARVCHAPPARSAFEEAGCGGRRRPGWQAEAADMAQPGAMCFMTPSAGCGWSVFFVAATPITPCDPARKQPTSRLIVSFKSTCTFKRKKSSVRQLRRFSGFLQQVSQSR